MISPALSESPAKTRSPGRRTGGSCREREPACWSQVVPFRDGGPVGRTRAPGPPRDRLDEPVAHGQLALIVSIAAWTLVPNSAESGADPAVSAAAAWPSLLAT